ncbi:universal stress protein [Mucilaginibacter sp. AK015]|uniref:universal stress protein n=1 Tax=Mucilaginibacter sp. AK015 TaxID=2723072 RepID=UPI00161D1C32|nr:universal stress protein [Mucilaginibacter sp. AK015]MBB5396836.1 nucleotide-binding universal stress UspA family protein [Mucilaginibacter sp. AK015]
MKKLLVLTDFSANAAHAESAALRLSSKMSADLVLYHTFSYVPMALSNIEGPLVTPDMYYADSMENLQKGANRLNELCATIAGCKTHIECKTGDGGLAENVRELTAGNEMSMVIMGGRTGGTIDHLLTGSDTAAVIRKSRKPVCIIPSAAQLGIPKKVVFATNFEMSDLPAVDFLLDLGKDLDFELQIVHILRPGEAATAIGAEMAFRKFLLHRGLTCKQVFREAVQPALQHYCADEKVDLLALSHQHHSLVARLFGHSESKAVIAQQQLPVIIFPPDYK